MRTIIAGSRSLNQIGLVSKAVTEAWYMTKIKPTLVLSGMAPGIDTLAVRWARLNGLPVEKYPAAWRDQDYRFNKNAGFQRNERMACAAEALIAVWDGHSGGTADMIERAMKHELIVHVFTVPWNYGRPAQKLPDPTD